MRRIAHWFSSGNLSENIATQYLHPSKFALRSDLGDLSSLMTSISRNGLIEPIIVRPIEMGFEIICGHRRFEACKKLRLKEIPCIIIHVNDRTAFEKSLVENIERRDVDPIDEARAFKRYVEEFGWGGVSELARTISKSEEYVSHRILLLELPLEILAKVSDSSINPSQARELMWMKNENLQKELSNIIIEQKLSVQDLRETAKLVKKGIPVKEAVWTVSEEKSVRNSQRHESNLVQVEKSETILRIAMMRLDNLIESVKDEQTREFLIKQRFGIHQLVDECIKRKKEVEAFYN